MTFGDTTCWTLIESAARGEDRVREEFARRYSGVVTDYLEARWGRSLAADEISDAVQEVFLECFKRGGALERVRRDAGGGFRPFLYGVCRNVARRYDERRRRRAEGSADTGLFEGVAADETALSRVFDRSWARALVQEAGERHLVRAESLGQEAVRRVELLRLRFQEGLPVRDIAERWGVDPAVLHQEYRRARREFHRMLRDVVRYHLPVSDEEVDEECGRLLSLLQAE